MSGVLRNVVFPFLAWRLGLFLFLVPSQQAVAGSLEEQGSWGPLKWSATSREASDLIRDDCKSLLEAWETLFLSPLALPDASVDVILADFETSEQLKGQTGSALLLLNASMPRRQRLEILARALFQRYQRWLGNTNHEGSAEWLLRGWLWQVLNEVKKDPWPDAIPDRLPCIADILGGNLGDNEERWIRCLMDFVNTSSSNRKKKLQFWHLCITKGASVHEMTILFEGFDPRLNEAELELLWQAYAVGAALDQVEGVFLSCEKTRKTLTNLMRIVDVEHGREVLLDMNALYLQRQEPSVDFQLRRQLEQLRCDLGSLHPYFFNAGISLGRVYESILSNNLTDFRIAVQQLNEDMQAGDNLVKTSDSLIEEYEAR